MSAQRKRIAILVSHPYATDPQLQKEASTLAQHGFQVQVVAWDREESRPEKERIGSIHIENISLRSSFGRGGLFHILKTVYFWVEAVRHLRKSGFDAVHCQDLNTIFPGVVVSKLYGKPVVFDVHDPYPEMVQSVGSNAPLWILRMMEHILSNRADVVLTVNRLMWNRLGKITRKPIRVVYNYPELSRFTPRYRSGTSKSKEIVIGRIGSIQPGTGIEEMIGALRQIAPDHPVKCILIGRIAERFREPFNAMIDPIKDRVQIVGPVPYSEVPRYYEQMDISIMIYRSTPLFKFVLPMKLFESMAMGVPVIASDLGETGAVIRSTGCGIALHDADIPSVAQNLTLLIGDPGLRRRMGQRGRAHVQCVYNWEQESQKLVDLYRNLTTPEGIMYE